MIFSCFLNVERTSFAEGGDTSSPEGGAETLSCNSHRSLSGAEAKRWCFLAYLFFKSISLRSFIPMEESKRNDVTARKRSPFRERHSYSADFVRRRRLTTSSEGGGARGWLLS